MTLPPPTMDGARAADRADPLAGFRDRFHMPRADDGSDAVYLCGNSLGLQPKGVRERIEAELEDWARLGVRGHLEGRTPWYSYHRALTELGAGVVGAKPEEVVHMNGLTVNLHLMMISFFRPTADRFRILIEEPSFSSDRYAVESQLRLHGIDPGRGLLGVGPRSGDHGADADQILAAIEEHGPEIALVLLGGVNFLTGEWLPMDEITRAGHAAGATVGFDLAHAAGNVPLSLHDWGVDFAAWCTYKYLNAGPGAVAGCFVHERHARSPELPRLAGWWGNDPDTRFKLQLIPDFVPVPGADGWQLSNPPILAMAPLAESLSSFDEAGMPALRAKSVRLTGFLEACLRDRFGPRIEIVTPAEADRRGCQLSIRIPGSAREVQERLETAGVVCDFREPDMLRVAPVPLYNRFEDVWTFGERLERALDPP